MAKSGYRLNWNERMGTGQNLGGWYKPREAEARLFHRDLILARSLGSRAKRSASFVASA